jgi:bifunctional non-homologous end joining protein LigD
MLAVAGELPADEEGWSFEMKWDGIRAVCDLGDGPTRILTRNDRNVAAGYPELLDPAPRLPPGGWVLDGEIVALDRSGRPSFGLLQQRMHVADAAKVATLRRQVPVQCYVFDVLHSPAGSTLELTYDQRQEVLESLELDDPPWVVPPVFVGTGDAALAASRTAGLEGVVAKLRRSTYQPGRRSHAWLKVKHVRMQEVVVLGWHRGQGRREGGIGSLLLGIPEDGGFRYVGKVGTGFSDAALDDLRRLLGDAVGPPLLVNDPPRADVRDAVWVEPVLVGEVGYGEVTGDGRLRHPTWRGLRPDKAAEDVRPEW